MSENQTPEPVVERFPATSGQLMGPFVILFGLAVTVGACLTFNRGTDVVAALGLLLAALGWASMVHPALWVTPQYLVLRGMVSTVWIPLAAVESYAVRQTLVVHAGNRRHLSSVLGRKRRRRVTPDAGGRMEVAEPEDTGPHEIDALDHFEQRLGDFTEAARAAAGVRAGSAAQLELGRAGVRRTVDLVPALVVCVPLALVVAAVLT